MDDHEAAANRLVQGLRPPVDVLVDLAGLVVHGSRIPFEADDPAHVMLLSFASKQHDHLHSVRVLVDAGQGADATIIARTMLEGTAQLLWALNHRPDGPELWWWYAAVMDWRQLRENELNGMPVDPEQWRIVVELLDKYGARYLSAKARKDREEGKPLPTDPYRRSWLDLDVRSMLATIRGELHYDLVYRTASERIHWNPRAMLRSLNIVNGVPRGYRRHDSRGALMALIAGFYAMHQALEVLDQAFGLGLEPRLASVLAKFEAERPADGRHD
ncbi:MAG: hypothetical protein AVDCRST_MAG49-541 [uncultured Thermomicrobiales bacterium]|uniref:Uncharacterized protein n=1 Tax=uncultured Thermomicrobiales bacterium TaxID=1645740 RepID=A0A6J4U2B2_9BACT|nr:MAG: hypothetical protein AVDCRST_MAG49-541 [uncultured Thermomicrobiales bacterium]